MATATKTRKPANKKAARPKMTATEARTFEATSEKSEDQVLEMLDARREESEQFAGCECSPYSDVFTFDRWIAQGRSVKKGEKSMCLHTFIPVRGRKNAAGQEEEPAEVAPRAERQDATARPKLRPWRVYLFCRCQTEKLTPGGKENKGAK